MNVQGIQRALALIVAAATLAACLPGGARVEDPLLKVENGVLSPPKDDTGALLTPPSQHGQEEKQSNDTHFLHSSLVHQNSETRKKRAPTFCHKCGGYGGYGGGGYGGGGYGGGGWGGGGGNPTKVIVVPVTIQKGWGGGGGYGGGGHGHGGGGHGHGGYGGGGGCQSGCCSGQCGGGGGGNGYGASYASASASASSYSSGGGWGKK